MKLGRDESNFKFTGLLGKSPANKLHFRLEGSKWKSNWGATQI